MGHPHFAASFVSAELDLSGAMCCEHFKKSEIEFVVAELVHERRQVNGAAIVDTRLVRNSRKRSDIDFAPGQRLNIQAQQVLDYVESKTNTAAVQCLVTSARFE